MKVHVFYIGKTSEPYLREGEQIFQKRLQHYLPIDFEIIPDVKGGGKLQVAKRKEKEGQALLSRLHAGDRLILLDEKGKSFTSVNFAQWLDKQLQYSSHRLVFAVGGAYGFSEEVYQRADGKLRLSDMTFSHQMIRVFLAEQLYRAMSILRGEKYHNE